MVLLTLAGRGRGGAGGKKVTRQRPVSKAHATTAGPKPSKRVKPTKPKLSAEEKRNLARRATARVLLDLGRHFNNAMCCGLCMDAGEVDDPACTDYTDVINLYEKEIHAFAHTLKKVRGAKMGIILDKEGNELFNWCVQCAPAQPRPAVHARLRPAPPRTAPPFTHGSAPPRRSGRFIPW